MLGTTVPEPTRDRRRVFVCSAGASQEFGSLIRIYPLARRDTPKRWDTFRVPLERNPQDSRRESFKLQADRDPGMHESVNAVFERRQTLASGKRAQMLARFVAPSIADANERRASLAILQPNGMELHFKVNEGDPDIPDVQWFDPSWAPEQTGSKHFPFAPYLRFTDAAGPHDLPLRDWGSYELMRKNLSRPDWYCAEMAAALHLSDATSLLVGNMNQWRNRWLVISVLNGIRPPRQLNLPMLTEGDLVHGQTS